MPQSYLPITETTADGSFTKPNPVIYDFAGKYAFLSSDYECQLTVKMGNAVTEVKSVTDGLAVAFNTFGKNAETVLTPEQAENFVPNFNDDPLAKLSCLQGLVALNEQKFQDPELMIELQATKPALLINGNTTGDTVLGFDVNKGFGDNLVGRALMAVRDGVKLENV
jgi:hypothetical protein